MFDASRKPVMEYPCPWEYKVIGPNESAMRRAVAEVLSELEHEVTFSHSSRTGRYCSLRVEIIVIDEQQRTDLFASLKAHRDILMVL